MCVCVCVYRTADTAKRLVYHMHASSIPLRLFIYLPICLCASYLYMHSLAQNQPVYYLFLTPMISVAVLLPRG